MCQRCNYREMLDGMGLDSTLNRLRVLEVIGSNPSPMGAREIFETLSRTEGINRVTVYRILDLLAEKGLVIRLSGLDRGMVYGLAPNENHPVHPHFQCRSCGVLQCMQPASINMDLRDVQRSFAGEIRSVDIRVSGICGNCLKTERTRKKKDGKRPDGKSGLSSGIAHQPAGHPHR
jgi:Fur family transcriptional regulator, ferric uptake regulator